MYGAETWTWAKTDGTRGDMFTVHKMKNQKGGNLKINTLEDKLTNNRIKCYGLFKK